MMDEELAEELGDKASLAAGDKCLPGSLLPHVEIRFTYHVMSCRGVVCRVTSRPAVR